MKKAIVALLLLAVLALPVAVVHAAPARPANNPCQAGTKMIEVEDTGYTSPDINDVQIKVGLNVLASINSTRDNLYYCGGMRGITKIVQGCVPDPEEHIGTGMRQWELHNPPNWLPWGYGSGYSHTCTTDTNGATWSDTGWETVPVADVVCADFQWDALGNGGPPIGGSQATTQKWCY